MQHSFRKLSIYDQLAFEEENTNLSVGRLRIKNILNRNEDNSSSFSEHMHDVTELNLRSISIRTLPIDLFRAEIISSLRSLSLSHNKLIDVAAVGRLLNLQRLDLSGNEIVIIPQSLSCLKHLLHLDLSNNKLRQLAFQSDVGRDEDEGEEMWKINGGPTSYDNLVNERRPNNKGAPPICNAAKTVDMKRCGERRKYWMMDGTHEWDVVKNVDDDDVMYRNNVSGESTVNIPSTLDSFAKLNHLVTLKLSGNCLNFLPESIGLLTQLQVLEASRNKLLFIPDSFCRLMFLKELKLDQNRLTRLPETLYQCKSLVCIGLNSNEFEYFPNSLIQCQSLQVIRLKSNVIRSLPYDVGFMPHLVDINMFDNPLQDPEYEYVMDSVDALLWECRQRHLELQNRGAPIVVDHPSGTCGERHEINPKFDLRINKTIKSALGSKQQVLRLQQQNLSKLPHQLYSQNDIRHLDLRGNHFQQTLRWTDTFSSLATLNISDSHVADVSPTINKLTYLLELNLERNEIVEVPDEMTELQNLRKLNLRMNRIHSYTIQGVMPKLLELNLDVNNLSGLPLGIENLTNLKKLSLQQNKLQEIDRSIVVLPSIKELNVCRNEIKSITAEIGHMKLTSLLLHCNQISTIDDEFLMPNLLKTLKRFRIDNNRLLQLPMCIDKMINFDDLNIDQNPFISPPQQLVQQGMKEVLNYCKVRRKRAADLRISLEKNKFETDQSHYYPVACGVLVGSTGFLAEEDLKEFDKIVDRYLNGEYYIYELSTSEIVSKIKQRRKERESTAYHLILEALLKVLLDENISDYLVQNALLRYDLERPWGKDAEMVSCFSFQSALLEENNCPVIVNGDINSSLCSLVKGKLEFTEEFFLLRKFVVSSEIILKSLNYHSPYGTRVARIEKVVYSNGKEKSLFSELMGSGVSSVVIVQVLHTFSEARRRLDEEHLIKTNFARVERTIDTWLESREGSIRLNNEARKRIRGIQMELKKKRQYLKDEQRKQPIAQDNIARETRKAIIHGKSRETDTRVKEAGDSLQQIEENISRIEQDIILLKAQKEGLNEYEIHAGVVVDLKQKYCLTIFSAVS